MASYSCGKCERSDWFLLGRTFAIRTVFTETVISRAFLIAKASKLSELLTNLAFSNLTLEWWPSVVLCELRCARSSLSRSRANVPLNGPRARSVTHYYLDSAGMNFFFTTPSAYRKKSVYVCDFVARARVPFFVCFTLSFYIEISF